MNFVKSNTIILALSLQVSVFASMGPEMFKGSDIDDNGCIDKKEAQAINKLNEEKIFDEFDENDNDCIDEAEFNEFFQQYQ